MKIPIKSIMLILFILTLIGSVSASEGYVSDGSLIKVSMLNQDPDPAKLGDIIEIRLSIGNYGLSSIEDLTISLEPEYPFLKLEGEEYVQHISLLKASTDNEQEIGIKFRMMVDNNAPDGTHTITVKSIETNSPVNTMSKNFEFELDVQGQEYAQIITIDKSQINLGVEEDLKFVITNTGGIPLKNVVFSWSEDSGTILPVFSDNNKYIKYLGVGDSQTVVYTVMADVNAVPGLYQLDLNMKFDSYETSTQEILTTAGVFVGGKTDFDVTFSEGDSGKTSLSIANIGNTPAYSVTVVVPKQNNFKVTGSSASIVGNLDKGDYTIVSFNIMDLRIAPTFTEPLTDEQKAAKQLANSENGLKVIVQYTDTSGKRHDIEKLIPIQLSMTSGDGTTLVPGSKKGMRGTQTPTSNGIWTNPTFYIPVIAIIIGIISYIVYKRKKKANNKKIK
ncbi:hypothetical protein HN695_07180 [Candidatus Woesearchaeota archaeon]|jgi:hypothetical protein|nr:hypothetical protein [Candidatus Woesearchaeota archaeon]MBT6040966.1 hypothetical protein [Candidatus Woesearchaeota archaeon]MBT6336144.1 hypothetical protein [Candidatus Woesearchaeota archaeon]MBT7928089.1 hypothetical protein [Candidatus Woesearchaeota archaeon]